MPELIEKTIYSGQEFFPKPIFSREEIVAELRIVLQRLLSTESPEFSEAALDKGFANFTDVIDAKKTAHGCCELGVHHYLTKKKGQAILFYLKTLQISPDSFDALHNIGVVFADLNQDNHAESAYSLAIQANPKHLVSWLDLGKIYLTRNYYHGGIFVFGQAVDIDSKCAEAWKGWVSH